MLSWARLECRAAVTARDSLGPRHQQVFEADAKSSGLVVAGLVRYDHPLLEAHGVVVASGDGHGSFVHVEPRPNAVARAMEVIEPRLMRL